MRISLLPLLFFLLPLFANASGWEETYLVVQDDSGRPISLEYWSDDEEDRTGVRVYVENDRKKNKALTRCFYKDNKTPLQLICTRLNGKPVGRVYRSEPLTPTHAKQAQAIYRNFVGKRLPSSVGSLDERVFVCIKGCSKGSNELIIQITCAECGMDESLCNERYEKRPKQAVIARDKVNVRSMASAQSEIIGTLHNNQNVRIVAFKGKCSELWSTGYLMVGRWIKIQSLENQPTLTGWIFDPYVKYEHEE